MLVIKVYENDILCVIESEVVGHYRGEDSGAIYPEYEYIVVEQYNLDAIKNHTIGGKTIHELIKESCKLYPYAGEMFTFPQASSIYSYLSSLEKMSELRIV